jgi:hypothetical protein
MDQAGLEYCWTKDLTREDETPPGPGWKYYGSSIIGSYDCPGIWWRVTRWAKEDGSTQYFVIREAKQSPESLLVGATPPNVDRGLVPPLGAPACGLQPPEKISSSATVAPYEVLGFRAVRTDKGVTLVRNVTPVTPPEIPPDDNSPSARLARALQLLKS